MGISIVGPPHINFSDTTSSIPVSISGKSPGTTLSAAIRIHGATVSSVTTTSTSFYMPLTASDIYSALNGKSLTNAATLEVYELDDLGGLVSSASLTGGDITINARLSNFSWANTPNPYDLDNPAVLSATWSRPHSAFRARVKIYVNNVLVINRFNFTTSMGFTPTSSELNAMISAMGGVSPRSLRYEFITQFNANSVIDLESTGTSITRSEGVIKSFAERSTISSFSDFQIGDTIHYSITQNTSGVTHDVELRFGTTTILTRTNVGGGGNKTITPSSGEITAMLNATPNSTSTTATLRLTTKLDGSQVGSVHSATATATVPSDITPDFNTITHTEATTNPDVAQIIGDYVQGVSQLNLAITGAVPGTGASITEYRFRIGSTTVYQGSSSSTIVGTSAFAGTGLTLEGRVRDSRGRTKTKTVSIDILPYSPPEIKARNFFRCNSDGSPNIVGDHARFTINARVSHLDGKNHLVITLKTREVGTTQWSTKQTLGPQTSPVVDGNIVFDSNSNIFSGFDVAKAYDGRIELSDKLYTAISLDSVSSGVLMSWGKRSIAIGKLVEDEDRLLDVAGDIWEDGQKLSDKYLSGPNPHVNSINWDGGPIRFRFDGPNGLTNEMRLGSAEELGGGNNRYELGFRIDTGATPRILRFFASEGTVRLDATGGFSVDGTAVVASGSNSNGWWVRWHDGTQICGHEGARVTISNSAGGDVYWANRTFTYPASFISTPRVAPFARRDSLVSWAGLRAADSSGCDIYALAVNSSATAYPGYIAFGWWK